MAYSIRPFRNEDASFLDGIIAAAIPEIGPRAYSKEQVAAWNARHSGPSRLWERVAQGHAIFVTADADDRPVAFVLIEPDGHLDQLYNDPAHTRRGLAAQLLARAETYATAHGVQRLYTEASELARPVFERAGYTVTAKREFTIAHDGRDVPIHNWAMEKRLK